MYSTKELRWFFKEDMPFIRQWFEQNHQMNFDKTTAREDFYLPQPGKKENGTKLREGNIEVKTRKGSVERIQFDKKSGGVLEHWTKWSFEVDPSDQLATKIIDQQKFNWLKTTKTRMGFKIVKTNKGSEVRNIKAELKDGCQVEYTRLKIKKDVWYTFAVENFGNGDKKLFEPIIKDISSGVRLTFKDSMGYPEFLDKYYF